MVWPLVAGHAPVINAPPHQGAFGAVRKFDIHTGVDIYCAECTPVVALETGIIVGIEDFTGQNAESPWWNDTQAILVEGPSGVVLYGEIVVKDGLQVGDEVREGYRLGSVKTVLKKDKGLPMTMLHFELYDHGTRESVWWRLDDDRPQNLRDPTELLKQQAQWW